MIYRKIDRREEKQTIRFKGMDLKETETQNKEKQTKRFKKERFE
jgi:endonuclease YncB( thermonuclease family)